MQKLKMKREHSWMLLLILSLGLRLHLHVAILVFFIQKIFILVTLDILCSTSDPVAKVATPFIAELTPPSSFAALELTISSMGLV